MYGKTWAAIAYAVAVALQTALGDRHVDPVEWVQIAIACATAVGVWLAPITSAYRWVKTDVALLLVVLQAVVTVMLEGWQSGDWMTLVIAGAGGLLVWVAPATSVSPSGAGNVSVPLGSDR